MNLATNHSRRIQVTFAQATSKERLQKDANGYNQYHRMLQLGLPISNLTSEILMSKGVNDVSVMHQIIVNGGFRDIPRDLLQADVLLNKDINNITPLHLLAEDGLLTSVPNFILTLENLAIADNLGNTSLHRAAGISKPRGFIVPTQALSLDMLSKKNKTGASVYHLLAKNSLLAKLPKKLITQDAIMLRDNSTQTVLHLVMKSGCLDQVPPELISVKNMLTSSSTGCTPMHLLENQDVHKLPIFCHAGFIRSSKEKQDWENLLEQFKIKAPWPIKDGSHLQHDGAWQEL